MSIQKVCRGYLGRKRIASMRNHQKMEQHFAFFDEIKDKLKKGNGLFISYWAKKKSERIRIKRMKALELAEKNKKKWGPRGPPKKKAAAAPVK